MTTPSGDAIRPPQAGFTYLWTLFAVAFIGIGMMLATELWSTSARRDREAELIRTGREFRDAIGRYYEASQGAVKQYPPSLDDLLKDPRHPGVRRHLRKVRADPITGKAEWGVVRVGGRIVGVHSLSQETPLKNANFEPAEAGFQGRRKLSEWVFAYPPGLPVGAANPGSATAVNALSTRPPVIPSAR